MKLLYYLSVGFLISSLSAHADRIAIHNRTPRDVYVAVYYKAFKVPFKDQPLATRATEIKFVEADALVNLERPSLKVATDRELVFVEAKELLKDTLTKDDLQKYHSKDVGLLTGDVFYIGDIEGEFYGYTTSEWNINKPIIEHAREILQAQVAAIVENPYKKQSATVRVGNDLPQGEKEYLAQRTPKVKKALEKLLGKSLEGKAIPKIAFVCSGGGYRAMLYTTGALHGAAHIGLLDAATYMVGLSGSTWAIGGWILSGKSIEDYHNWLVNNIRFGLRNFTSSDVRLMSDYLLVKYFFDEPFDVVDIYGGLLANELFAEKGNLKQRQTLSSQIDQVRAGSIPFPIYTAVAAESIATENKWYEFTPYEVGASWLNMYVPSWAFGRKFKNGTSVTFAPEQNFGVLMATFGLAIGITLSRIMQEADLNNKISSPMIKNIINRIEQAQGERRITSSDFSNFTFGMSASKYADARILRLVDAGINFNLPYPVISGERQDRKADVIIFLDASGDEEFSKELRKTEQYARNHGLKFPPIDYTDIEKRAISIFKNEQDPQVPVIIYIPRVLEQTLFDELKEQSAFSNFRAILTSFDVARCIKEGPCSTFNFNYTTRDALTMTSLGQFNVMAGQKKLIEAINWKIDTLSPR